MADEIITQQQSDMITMLIAGENITDIARKLNVNRNTVYNWKAKDYIRMELDRRKRELKNQGEQIILKDINTYIENIKCLANDKTDKRVCLAANQYLLNRIFGNPAAENKEENNSLNVNDVDAVDALKVEIKQFKMQRLSK